MSKDSTQQLKCSCWTLCSGCCSAACDRVVHTLAVAVAATNFCSLLNSLRTQLTAHYISPSGMAVPTGLRRRRRRSPVMESIYKPLGLILCNPLFQWLHLSPATAGLSVLLPHDILPYIYPSAMSQSCPTFPKFMSLAGPTNRKEHRELYICG